MNDQPKKNLNLNILSVLKKYSDEDHKLTQKEINKLLEKEYGESADRKAVLRNLRYLREAGIRIGSTGISRANSRTGEEEYAQTDFFLIRDFSDDELCLLIDSVMCSNNITYEQRYDLIKKIERLSNKYFRDKMPPEALNYINTYIKPSNDIVSVVSSYIKLNKRGDVYLGLCPFHQGKTPVLKIYPETNTFYCSVCKFGGYMEDFITRIENNDTRCDNEKME